VPGRQIGVACCRVGPASGRSSPARVLTALKVILISIPPAGSINEG
jgi:hypothetical protein